MVLTFHIMTVSSCTSEHQFTFSFHRQLIYDPRVCKTNNLKTYLPSFNNHDVCNHIHNILKLLNVLPSFPFTTSEATGDYYL